VTPPPPGELQRLRGRRGGVGAGRGSPQRNPWLGASLPTTPGAAPARAAPAAVSAARPRQRRGPAGAASTPGLIRGPAAPAPARRAHRVEHLLVDHARIRAVAQQQPHRLLIARPGGVGQRREAADVALVDEAGGVGKGGGCGVGWGGVGAARRQGGMGAARGAASGVVWLDQAGRRRGARARRLAAGARAPAEARRLHVAGHELQDVCEHAAAAAQRGQVQAAAGGQAGGRGRARRGATG
jgi:hypothetical protein